MILKTSNKYKIDDYKLIGFPNLIIKEGEDLKEIKGTIDEIILYKSLDSKINELVEDSTIIYDNKEFIDIKYNINKLPENELLSWIVSIGYKKENTIEIYRGITEGYLVNSKNINSKNYDMNKIFVPKGFKNTLSNIKDFYLLTPRYKSLIDIKNQSPYMIKNIKDIPKWNGEFQ